MEELGGDETIALLFASDIDLCGVHRDRLCALRADANTGAKAGE
jgi:hypothetical protein